MVCVVTSEHHRSIMQNLIVEQMGHILVSLTVLNYHAITLQHCHTVRLPHCHTHCPTAQQYNSPTHQQPNRYILPPHKAYLACVIYSFGYYDLGGKMMQQVMDKELS